MDDREGMKTIAPPHLATFFQVVRSRLARPLDNHNRWTKMQTWSTYWKYPACEGDLGR